MMRLLVIFAGLLLIVSCGKKIENETEKKPVSFDLRQIDSTVDPCDNFYKFAIGQWQKDHPVPPTESRWMAFNILDNANKKKLLTIIETVAADNNLSTGSEGQMIRDLYLSALDTANLESEGLKTLAPYFKLIENINTVPELLQSFFKLAQLSIGSPFSYRVVRDKKNSEQYVVTLSQGGLSLPDRDYYLQQDEKSKNIREAFKVYTGSIFEMAGFQDETPGSRILQLEKSIAKKFWTRTQLRDPYLTYNKKSIEEWNKYYALIDIKQSMEMHGLTSTDSLIIGQPGFFKGMDSLLGVIPMSEWKLYLKWHIINSYSTFLGDRFEKAHFSFFSTTLRGTAEMKPRNERILNVLNATLGEPLGKLYVKEYFPEESKEYMVGMIENLRSAYRDRIVGLTWMGPETKEKALRKLEAFTYKIGYPDKWKDYSELEISPDNYAENIINARIWSYDYMINKLGSPVDKTEWFMPPQMVNAYYNSSGNEIVFPAGILQPPFFHPTFDRAINYGGIGAVIGHEFTHGFDDQGSKYDWNGNLSNWWTAEDRLAFDKLGARLAEQYSSYNPIDTMHVKGKMTLGENIADLGGITISYAALQKAYKEKYPESIDGFTWQQRFFLGWVNVWKGNITDEELRNRLITDPHSPAEYRGNGPLINFDPYYEAFGVCEQGKMYKPDSLRIRIW